MDNRLQWQCSGQRVVTFNSSAQTGERVGREPAW